MHAFADVSKQAYAAVVSREYDTQGNRTFESLIGKSRLALIKNQKDLDIPSCLLRYVDKSLRLPIHNQFLWVDSEIVLSRYNITKLLPPFVASRINEIKFNKELTMRYVLTDRSKTR